MATSKTATELETKKKEGYYLRLHLLVVKYGTPVLRARFDHSVPPVQLHKTLQQLIGTINYAKGKNIISRKQYGILYPQYAPPTSTDFDVSLLVYLLRHTCGLDRKSKWWSEKDNGNIPDTETSEEADVVRIRNIRNETQHSQEAEIGQTVFEEKWDILEKAMLRLATTSGMQSLSHGITVIKTDPLDIVKEKITYIIQSSDDDYDSNDYYDHFSQDQDDYDYDSFQDDYDHYSDDQDDNDNYSDDQDCFDHYDDTQDDHDDYSDNQDCFDHFDDSQDDYDNNSDNQYCFDHYDDSQDDHDNYSDNEDYFDHYDDTQDDHDNYSDDQDCFDHYDDSQDDHDNYSDNQDDFDHYDDLQDDHDNYSDNEDYFDHYDDTQDDYDNYSDDQDCFDHYDDTQDDYDNYSDNQDYFDQYFDHYDDLQDCFYRLIDDSDKRDSKSPTCEGNTSESHAFKKIRDDWRVTKSEDVIFLLTCIIALMGVVIMTLISIIIVLSESNMKKIS